MPVGDEQLTPAGRARMRWKWAIEQQLLLLKIEKQNQSVIGKFTAIKQSITMFLWSYSHKPFQSLHVHTVCTHTSTCISLLSLVNRNFIIPTISRLSYSSMFRSSSSLCTGINYALASDQNILEIALHKPWMQALRSQTVKYPSVHPGIIRCVHMHAH